MGWNTAKVVAILLFFKIILQFIPMPIKDADKLIAVYLSVILTIAFLGVLAKKAWAYYLGFMTVLIDLAAAAWAGSFYGAVMSVYDVIVVLFCIKGNNELRKSLQKQKPKPKKKRRK